MQKVSKGKGTISQIFDLNREINNIAKHEKD